MIESCHVVEFFEGVQDAAPWFSAAVKAGRAGVLEVVILGAARDKLAA